MNTGIELRAHRCLQHGCDRLPPCKAGTCQAARESFAPAPLQAETAPTAAELADAWRSEHAAHESWSSFDWYCAGAIRFATHALDASRQYERPAARQEPSAPAEPLLSRQMLIGDLVNKWSGNDEIKASDVLEWVMSQPLASAPAQAVQSTAMNQAADLLAESMMLADADRVRSGALVVEAHNMLVGTHAIEQPELAQQGDKLWCETCEGSGRVYQEHQRGVVGSGGDHHCPDCDGRGYWTRQAAPAQAGLLTDGQCDSILNHLAFRFLLDVNDEKRPRMRQAVREALIEARNAA